MGGIRIGNQFYTSGKKEEGASNQRDTRSLEEMTPGEKWTRLDGQERTVPERCPVVVQREVVGREEKTRMDGRKFMAPIYDKN